MSEPTLYQRIRDGEFTTELPFISFTDESFTKEDRLAALAKRRKDVYRLNNLFRIAALEEVGLTGHPKAAKCWTMAWDRGHASGHSAVLLELEEIAELVL